MVCSSIFIINIIFQSSTSTDFYFNQHLYRYVVPSTFYNSVEWEPAPKCHPNTREVVLTKIMKWLKDPTSEAQILWMHGFAGAGKMAVITQTIVEMCTQAGKSVASFFFLWDVTDCNTGKRLVPSLAYQLSHSILEIRESIARTLEDDPLLPSWSITKFKSSTEFNHQTLQQIFHECI